VASVVLAALLTAAALTESLRAADGIQTAQVSINRQSVSLQATQTFSNVEFIGQIGGSIGAMTVQGNYAYVRTGYSLAILNISDKTRPARVGQTPPMP